MDADSTEDAANSGNVSTVSDGAREIYDRDAKERQKRKPANSVVENLPQQTDSGKSRDAVGKAIGVSGKTRNRHATGRLGNQAFGFFPVLAVFFVAAVAGNGGESAKSRSRA